MGSGDPQQNGGTCWARSAGSLEIGSFVLLTEQRMRPSCRDQHREENSARQCAYAGLDRSHLRTQHSVRSCRNKPQQRARTGATHDTALPGSQCATRAAQHKEQAATKSLNAELIVPLQTATWDRLLASVQGTENAIIRLRRILRPVLLFSATSFPYLSCVISSKRCSIQLVCKREAKCRRVPVSPADGKGANLALGTFTPVQAARLAAAAMAWL